MHKKFKEMHEKLFGKAKDTPSVIYDCKEAGECGKCEYKDGCGAYEDTEVPDFLADATNVYRTKYFIVKQQFIFNNCGICGTQTLSNDTFYARTPERDEVFDALFEDGVFTEGKRLPVMASMRTYRQ